MRFLCLHGAGTNSQVLEAQTAGLRHELGDTHSYDYAEGTIACPIAPEISSYFPADDEYYAYFDPSKPSTFEAALDHLEAFIAREGPYDVVLAYSHGAQLVVPMLARLRARDPGARPFDCAVFLSGGIPYDFRLAPDSPHLTHVDAGVGPLVHIPTANIWGKNDTLHPGTSEVLSSLCRPEWRTIFTHSGGHDIPGSKDRQDLLGCVKAVRRTLDMAVVA